MTASKTGLWIDHGNTAITTTEPADGELLVPPGGEITVVVEAIVAGINGDVEPGPAVDPKPKPEESAKPAKRAAKKRATKKAAANKPELEPTEKES